MTRSNVRFAFLTAAVLSLTACTSRQPSPDVAWPEMPPSNLPSRPGMPTPPSPATAEMRGVWISDPKGINWTQAMRELRGAGFNTVFVNFNSAGAAFYPSRILPDVAGRDEMRLCLDAAHAQGMQVHAKFIVWYMFQSPVTLQRKLAKENRLLRTPEGAILFQGESTWLNPGLKSNHDERLAAIREVLQSYPVDGVQLDYIRYPDNAGKITGGRLDVNTRFVWDVRSEMRKLRPGIPLSISNFYDYRRARNEMGQDWVLWAQRRYVDFLCPMDYTRDPEQFYKWVQTQQKLIKGNVPIYPGIGSYMLTHPQQVNEQIELARRNGTGGFVVFAYNDQFRQQMLPGLRF